MENELNDKLNDFLSDENELDNENEITKKTVMYDDKSLTERVDRDLITEDGRFLLND